MTALLVKVLKALLAGFGEAGKARRTTSYPSRPRKPFSALLKARACFAVLRLVALRNQASEDLLPAPQRRLRGIDFQAEYRVQDAGAHEMCDEKGG
jgi:hypothetical protein